MLTLSITFLIVFYRLLSITNLASLRLHFNRLFVGLLLFLLVLVVLIFDCLLLLFILLNIIDQRFFDVWILACIELSDTLPLFTLRFFTQLFVLLFETRQSILITLPHLL